MRRRDRRPPFRVLPELLLGLAAGAGAAALAFAWLAPFHLAESLTAADFLDYCTGVVSLVDADPSLWPLKRARLAGWPAARLSQQHGVVDGLLIAAIAATGLMSTGLYLWGSALAGRSAGLATVALALSMSPLVIQARMLSYYPVVNATLALAASGVAIAARVRSLPAFLGAGLGIGLCLNADLRALVWALPFLGVSLLVAILGKVPPRVKAARLLALGLPLVAAHSLGQWSYPRAAYSLEQQLDVRPLFHLHGARGQGFRPPFDYSSRYIWGTSPLSEIPETLSFLARQARIAPPPDVQMHTPQGLLQRQVLPWVEAARWLVPLALVLLVVKGQPLMALVLSATCLPYLVALRGTLGMVELYPRFLTQSLPAVALCGGVAAGLLWEALPWTRLGRPGPMLATLTGGALALALTLGAIDSPLSPVAPWRLPWAPVLTEVYETGRAVRSPTPPRDGDPFGPCVTRLRQDRRRLGEGWSRLLPYDDRQQVDYRDQLSTVPPAHPDRPAHDSAGNDDTPVGSAPD